MPTKGPTLRVTFDPSADQLRDRASRVADQLFSMFLGDLEDKLFPNFLSKLIQQRTKSGKDTEGAEFKRYAPRYEKQGTPDLTATGELLRSLTGQREPFGFSVAPAGSHRGSVTAQMLAAIVSKERPFVGFDRQDERIITAMMESTFRNETAEKIEALLSGRP